MPSLSLNRLEKGSKVIFVFKFICRIHISVEIINLYITLRYS